MAEFHVAASLIYYSDCRVREPIFSTVQRLLEAVGLPIVSVTLNKPVHLGTNVVIHDSPGYPTMVRQIVTALEHADAEHVFFCEHDVLLHPSHFAFTPERDDTFYYDVNVWRWLYGSPTAITYDEMKSLSCMCANRQLALNHFQSRLEVVEARPEEFQTREPRLPRVWGYEPGTKKRRRGGFSDEPCDTWRSEFPNVDIRHRRCYSPPKVTLESFKHKPTGWVEKDIGEIPGWDIRGLFP